MQGAREYATLLPTGQYGRFFVYSGEHVRGKYFHLYVLPADVILYAPKSLWKCKDAVEVYGVTGDAVTETYGWLHHGSWQQSFERLVEWRRAEVAAYEADKEQRRTEAETRERTRTATLLAGYAKDFLDGAAFQGSRYGEEI